MSLCTQIHKCHSLGFSPENTHPTLTRPHAHIFTLIETHFKHKIFRKTPSALPVCLGGPGSGKGTQCMKIAERYGFHYVSVGELLRKKMIHNATINRKWSLIARIITNGELAPQVELCVSVRAFCCYLSSASVIIIASTHPFFPLPLYFTNSEQKTSPIVFSTLFYIF